MADLRLLFEKRGRAVYISHLDLMHTFQRAFLRAGLQIRNTEGFHPHAFVSIVLPLSVGYSSQCELLEFGLNQDAPAGEIPARLNAALPQGIHVLSCAQAGSPARALAWVDWELTLEYDRGTPPQLAGELDALLCRPRLEADKPAKKNPAGFIPVDIIPLLRSWDLTPGPKTAVLRCVLAAQNPGMNPRLLLSAIGRHAPALVPDFVRCHRREVLTAEGKPFR